MMMMMMMMMIRRIRIFNILNLMKSKVQLVAHGIRVAKLENFNSRYSFKSSFT